MTARPATAWKVLTADQMATLEADGRFAGSPDDARDGFIHLSTADQIEGTLAKHYAGQADLHLAEVDLEALGTSVRWEPARGTDFPHLYADLPLSAIVAYGPLDRDDDGTLKLPVAG